MVVRLRSHLVEGQYRGCYAAHEARPPSRVRFRASYDDDAVYHTWEMPVHSLHHAFGDDDELRARPPDEVLKLRSLQLEVEWHADRAGE